MDHNATATQRLAEAISILNAIGTQIVKGQETIKATPSIVLDYDRYMPIIELRWQYFMIRIGIAGKELAECTLSLKPRNRNVFDVERMQYEFMSSLSLYKLLKPLTLARQSKKETQARKQRGSWVPRE